jgi:hypothetical protein
MMIQVRLVEAVREAGSLPVLGSVVHPNLSLLRLSMLEKISVEFSDRNYDQISNEQKI